MPLVFEGLQLVVMLAPVRFRSDSFADRVFRVFRGLALNAKVFTFAECLIRICISTIFVSRTLRAQEKGLGEAAEANKELREQLQSLTELHDWPDVDMGTPLEKLTMIIKSLKPGCALSPEQVHQMQVLITADDLHKPQFLSDIRSADADAKRDLADSETGKWISLIATGRRTTDHTSTSAMTSSQTSPSSEGSASSSSGRNVDSSKPGRASLRLDASLHKLAHAAAASPIHEEFAVHMHPTPDAGQNRHATGVPTSEHRLPCQHAVHPQGLPVKPIGITSGAGTRFFTLRRCSRGTTERCELKTLMLTAQCAVPKVWEVPGGNEPQVENGLRRSLSFDSGTNNTSEALAVSPRAQSLDQMSTAPTLCKCPTSFTEQQRRQVGPLSQLGSWNFDVLELDAAAGEMTIPLVGYSLFFRSGFILEFDINEQKLANFLSEISRGMNNNPYHNAAHIADVSASVFHLLTYSGVGDHLRSIDKLAIVCAALIHDYKHPGVNNDFLSRTREELATMYNDHSPLENYHLAEAFYLLYSKGECNFLEVLREEDFVELRRVVIEVVLATDLKRHFKVLDALKARVAQEVPWDMERDSDRILLLQMMLKLADIGHSAKPWVLHKEWSYRVVEEFYRQGDEERALSLTVSPFMDRHNNNIPRSQLGFFQFLAVPLFEAWVKCFPASGHLLQNVSQNIEFWKRELTKNTSGG